MKIKQWLVTSAIIGLSALSYAEPPNISLLKQELIAYHDSGLYEKEIERVVNKAQDYLNEQVQANNKRTVKQKLALVLDIDETSLSNYDYIIKRDFVGNMDQIHQEILQADAPAIKPTLDLYNNALKAGVSVFFLTGRDDDELKATAENLKKAGYDHWTELLVRSKQYKGQPAIAYKTQIRDLITKRGYTIIATIGDQYSDLIGGYANKEFKLPNPYYFLP